MKTKMVKQKVSKENEVKTLFLLLFKYYWISKIT